VDELYGLVVVRPLGALSRFCHRVVDVVLIDLLGVNGSAFAVKALGVVPRLFHDGRVQTGLLAIVAGVVCLWLFL
jgi:NADH:ubiquinone oxidoreductase subunit 5 (subunit L)/multisubunit Na+/H+ antiporter MnhA subunit